MSAAWPGSSEGSNSDSDGGAGSSLLRDAEEPAEPFTKWEGYREGYLTEEESDY